MKKLLAFVVSIAMCASFAACGEKKDDTGKTGDKAPTLAFICKDLSQEWFVGTSTSMQKTAKSLGAKDVILYDCSMSPDKYMTALDNAISQKVDVLIA